MTDPFAPAFAALKALEQEQRERFRPRPEAPLTPAEAYLKQLNASCSPTVSVDVSDAGWLP